jgi:MFS family permease
VTGLKAPTFPKSISMFSESVSLGIPGINLSLSSVHASLGAICNDAAALASFLRCFGPGFAGYSLFSPVAGATLDRLGPRRVMPTAAAIIFLGAQLFALRSRGLAGVADFCKESEALCLVGTTRSDPTISVRLSQSRNSPDHVLEENGFGCS